MGIRGSRWRDGWSARATPKALAFARGGTGIVECGSSRGGFVRLGNGRKVLKRVLIIVAVALALRVLGVWVGGNAIARTGVEVGASKALGVPASLDGVSIGWLTSSVAIRGLEIGNPEGYSADRLLALDRASVACKVTSLLSDTVEVHEIVVDRPELTVELKPGIPPRSNLGDLLASLKSEPAPAEETEGKKFKIGLIRVTNTKVRFQLPGGKTKDLKLPDIELRDLKNADGTPVMLAGIFRQVLASMARSVAKHGKGILPDDILRDFTNTTAIAQKILQRGMERVKDKLGKEAAGKVGGLLKSILKKRNKD